VSHRITIGNKIRQLRRERGLTLAELGRKSGVSISQISEMERGLKSPTVGILIKVAQGLGVRASDLLGEADATHVMITKKNERKKIVSESGKFSYEEVSKGITNREMDIFLWHFEPGYEGKPQARPGEEIGLVLKGEIELTVSEEKAILDEGACYQIKANLPHYHKNIGDETADVLIIRRPPLFT